MGAMFWRGVLACVRILLGLGLIWAGYGLLAHDPRVGALLARLSSDPPFGVNWWAVVLIALGGAFVLQAFPDFRDSRKPPAARAGPTLTEAVYPAAAAPPVKWTEPPAMAEAPCSAAFDRPAYRAPAEHAPPPDPAPPVLTAQEPIPSLIDGPALADRPVVAPHFRSRPERRSGYRRLFVTGRPFPKRI